MYPLPYENVRFAAEKILDTDARRARVCTQETVVLAAYQPIRRIVLERQDGRLVVVEVEFDDSLSPSPLLPPLSPDVARESPGVSRKGSK